ncbi:MAG: hypothetical protein LBH40_01935, partial [Alphaproteobacteria bacterium]|nr:hypothetical protein [Alphaproteobacteria bacterium]
MFKFRLFYLLPVFAIFLLVPHHLKAADNVSGGNVVFGDEASNRNNPAGAETPQEGEIVDFPTSGAQVDATREKMKVNLKKAKRSDRLDATTMFTPDKAQNLYGINLLVIKINVKRDKSGRVIGLLAEDEKQPTSFINQRNNPEHFLNLASNNFRDREYTNSSLYKSHQTLLRDFVNRVPRDQDAIVLMYTNGSTLKNLTEREMQLEKTIYAQYVTNFLYRNKKRLIIERRYVDEIPENEIFLIISRFEGNIPPNIYNSSKGNILQWLARYKELERQNIINANNARNSLEASINSTTNTKNPAFLSTSVQREVKQSDPIMRVDENTLFTTTRNVEPRPNPNGPNGGPRRVAPPVVEEA